MNNNYIRLPILKEIEVRDYTLFEKDWKYEFKKGLNLFLGGNTLGKTTSVYIILYGITGLPKEKMDFFTTRSGAYSKDKIPTVKIKIELYKSIIELVRSLKDSSIISLSINGNSIEKENNNLEEIYESKINSLSGISTIEDYQFLLEKLLIREEEGEYLLWNPDDQAKVLRILFGYEGLEKNFQSLKENVRKYDSKWRGQQDIQAQFKKRLEAIKIQKSDRLKKLGAMSIEELENKIQSLEKENQAIINKRKLLSNKIKDARSIKYSLDKEKSLKNNKIEEIEAEIIYLENQFFEAIYSDPKMLLAHHKLEIYGICMFCNQRPSSNVKKKVILKIENNLCPVCGSQLTVGLKAKVPQVKKEVIEKLNIKRKEASELKKELETLLKKILEKESEVNERWDCYLTLENDLRDKITEIDDLNLRLSDMKEDKMRDIATYDRDIKTLNKQIEFYQEDIEKARNKYDDSIKSLKKLNNEFGDNIRILQDNLIKIFKRYAGALFLNCELDIQHEKPKGSKIRLPVFLPRVNNVLRKSLDEISKSESIFLEYAFRMSLCELFNSITDNEINLIIETSEGVFDVGVIDILADSLSKFSNKNHYLLIVSNLGREDFLKSLINKTKIDLSKRMVNFFDIGRLSGIQKKNISEYKEVINRIISTKSNQMGYS